METAPTPMPKQLNFCVGIFACLMLLEKIFSKIIGPNSAVSLHALIRCLILGEAVRQQGVSGHLDVGLHSRMHSHICVSTFHCNKVPL